MRGEKEVTISPEIEELKLTGVDRERIEKNDSFPCAYRYPFKLSAIPNSLWTEVFEHVYAMNLYSTAKREASVSGNCIIVILADSDDKQQQADIIKRAIVDTNSEYKKLCEKIVKERQGEGRMDQEQERKLQELRDEADKLQF